jgi:hypothetical protein
MAKPKSEPPRVEFKVFITNNSPTCDDCEEELGRGAWITLQGKRGCLCLPCADLDHLEFLPSGDAALTVRAKRHSTLRAVVLKWSRARKRYERQGLLVEREALEKAEASCLADADLREAKRARRQQREAELDGAYVIEFGGRIRALFPGCPPGREKEIAERACLKYSGRIGRSAAGKCFDEKAVRLAVQAHVRHAETSYDHLLSRGWDRSEARERVQHQVFEVLNKWATGPRS